MTDYADLTNLADILKNVYGEGITNQFADEKVTYNQFPKSDRKPGGKGYVFGIRYARSQSVGARAESVYLPDPFTGTKDQGTITPKYIYGSIRLTGPGIEAAKANTMAFVDGLADEMDDIYQSIIVDLNRQCHGDGFGLLATLSSAAAAVTTATWIATCDNDTGVMYVQEGMVLDVYNAAGTAIMTTCAAHRVSAVFPATKIVKFERDTTGLTWKAHHPISTIRGTANRDSTVVTLSLLVKMGARLATHSTTDTQYEICGLDGLFDDGTLLASFEGITVASYPKWAANVIDNSAVNRELSIDLMLNALDVTRERSGKSVKIIRMGLGQRRKYANLLLPDVRYAPMQLRGGYEVLTFSGGDGSVEILVDPLTQKNKMYFDPGDVIKKYELTPLGWGNLDGNQMHRNAGYDEWDLFLRIYTQLGVEMRNCLTVLDDLVEPTVY